MRPALTYILLNFALTAPLGCGDDGRGSGTSAATATPTTATTVGSFGTGTTDGTDGTDGTGDTSGSPTTGSQTTTAATVTTGPDDPTSGTTSGTTDVTTFPPTSTSLPQTTGFDPPNCDPVLKATIRDFRQSHPDFQTYTGDNAYTGIVEQDLGPDSKPVYAHAGPTPQTTGPGEFAQWYNDVPNENIAFEVDIALTEVMPGQFTYQNGAFFPIDDQGWGNDGNNHNFHFTTEIHTEFTYQGGEVFTFTGDDDLWLFINKKLAIDLGGLHPQLTDTIDLDANAGFFGIQIGGTYAMDIFHAERHTDESNFRIDTSIECFIIPG